MKERNRKLDFNISLFSEEIFVDSTVKKALEHIDNLAFFKVKTGDGRDFYYLNPQTRLNIVDFKNKEDLLSMMRHEKYVFRENLDTGTLYLFRDPNVPYEIFVTERFIKEFGELLKGIVFIELPRA